jgi:hypothetical protein
VRALIRSRRRSATTDALRSGAAKLFSGRPSRVRVPAGWRGSPRSVSGGEVEYFGMGPAVVLGQDFAEIPGTVCDGAVADLAAGDR